MAKYKSDYDLNYMEAQSRCGSTEINASIFENIFKNNDIINFEQLLEKLVMCDNTTFNKLIMSIIYAKLGQPKNASRLITTHKIYHLVSNKINYANNADLNLTNPRGIVVYDNKFWIANNILCNYDLCGNQLWVANDTLHSYDLVGNKLILSDSVRNPDCSTDVCINPGCDFKISITRRPVELLMCTKNGMVHGYNSKLNPNETYVLLNNQQKSAMYTGLAVANNILYLANFSQNKIEAYDCNYNRMTSYEFVDLDMSDPIPGDYSVVNIKCIGCYLYVVYVKRNAYMSVTEEPGCGYISQFNLNGSFVRRFISRQVLNSPWAIIPAPVSEGIPPSSILVGNSGDGRINIFDCDGKYIGPLFSSSGLPVSIRGLRGMAPYYTDINQIFVTSYSNQDECGLISSIANDQVIRI